MAAIGLKHCSHCKGRRGPCQCTFGCPIPTNALRKSQCYPVHIGTTCDSCGSENFLGSRFKCQACSDFDLCQLCYEGGRHDNTHPFFRIAGLGRPSELLQPRRETLAALPIPARTYIQPHHSSVSSVSTAASTSSMPKATIAAAANTSSLPTHTGISCDSCGTVHLQGNRFKCQTCDDFDLCQSCFANHTHDRSHAFALIAAAGSTPILLAKPQNADLQTATASPLRASAPREPQNYSSAVRHQTFTAASPIPPFAPHVNGVLREVDDADSTPPYLTESSTSFSSSQPGHSLYQDTADASDFSEMSSTSLKAPQPPDQMPYVPECWQRSKNKNATPSHSEPQEETGYSATTFVPSRQNAGSPMSVLHCNVFCDGAKCRDATQCIVGPRYTCAICPPSVDLCQECYTSESAHNTSHSFKRFDQADELAYVTCPPQQQQQQQKQQQQQQTRQEQHPDVFCDGARCRGATQCIVGPRYTCANCPPSFDLCQACYMSKSAHNNSHSFMRFDKAGLTTYELCPPQMPQPQLQQQQQQQQQQQNRQEQHPNVFCDGPRCRGATQCIVGPRYTCANCPPSIDLCHGCYSSQSAHNVLHSFKRFDKANLKTYVTCPPQMQQPQQQQQTRPEEHTDYFCDGPRCHDATRCIVGPRYTCANCPPSVDLCHTCYSSQSAHDTSHSFQRFDRAGSSSFVTCPPLRREQPPQYARQDPPIIAPNGGSHFGAAPPNRPSTNAANQGGQHPPDRFHQAMQTGIEVLENVQTQRQNAQFVEQIRQQQEDALEYQNALLAYQQEMLYQQQMQYQQQQEPVATEQYYDNSYQYTEEPAVYEFNVQDYGFSFEF